MRTPRKQQRPATAEALRDPAWRAATGFDSIAKLTWRRPEIHLAANSLAGDDAAMRRHDPIRGLRLSAAAAIQSLRSTQ